jgi:hypothetical protein
MITEELDYIILAFIAGEVDWAPIIKAFPVYFNRIAILTSFNYRFRLIILSFFTVLP